jgi:hypothetical protein
MRALKRIQAQLRAGEGMLKVARECGVDAAPFSASGRK